VVTPRDRVVHRITVSSTILTCESGYANNHVE
jgi:hypothetical protein